MKKFTSYIREDNEYKLFLESVESPEIELVNFLTSGEIDLNDFLDKKMIRYKKEYIDKYKSEIKDKLKELSDNIKTDINDLVEESIMTDDEIADTYSSLSLQEIKFEARDMSYMYNNKTFEGMVVWSFRDEDEEFDEDDLTVGGFSESVEDFMYATEPNENGDYIYKYATNNWYPEDARNKMNDIIEAELLKKYGHEYEVGSLDYKDEN